MQSSQLIELINEVRVHKNLPPVDRLTAELRLREDLGFVSLDLAELTVRIEDTFGVDVFADGVVSTVGEIEAKLPRQCQS